ncbi:redoxin domain-containing protein [Halorussus salilacus]|uniref:redoxin domain-containing protein n=1 Tax=Halorussus salilacus TaxID=2953750 RepID=UPI0020A068A5|nr:redoxin domain-containing protein [Halorussus salilacus]USZ69245.1 redoxin domain-containing protein [Halorussus salilacus]
MGAVRDVEVGSTAPAFTAPLVTPDGEVSEVSLSSLCEETAVLLVFQPTDFDLDTFAERAALGEYDWFTADDRLRVVGVNRARPVTNREFADYLDVTYPFCSDRDLSIAKAYGVTYRALGVAPRARRACFFVDRDRVVRYQWVGDRTTCGRARPQARDLYEAVVDALGRPEPETFGMA